MLCFWDKDSWYLFKLSFKLFNIFVKVWIEMLIFCVKLYCLIGFLVCIKVYIIIIFCFLIDKLMVWCCVIDCFKLFKLEFVLVMCRFFLFVCFKVNENEVKYVLIFFNLWWIVWEDIVSCWVMLCIVIYWLWYLINRVIIFFLCVFNNMVVFFIF